VVSPELLIFDQMAESVALYDGQGRFLYANPAMLRRMAMTLEQVRGRAVWEIYPDAHDNDFSRTLRRVLQTGKAETLEHHYPPWDAWFDNHFYASRLGVCVIALDITSRKRAEQEARALLREKELEQRSLTRLLESIPAAVAVLRGPEWTYELSNLRNDEIGGRGPLLGKCAPEVFPELVAQGFIGLLEHVAKPERPMWRPR
jgi:PAS domain-containing protein